MQKKKKNVFGSMIFLLLAGFWSQDDELGGLLENCWKERYIENILRYLWSFSSVPSWAFCYYYY